MKIISIFVLSVSSFAFADSETRNINQILSNIEYSVNYDNHDPRTLRNVRKMLTRVENVLNGQTNPGGGTPELLCVARDNDNRAPYQIAIRDPRTLRTTKISHSTVGSLNNCKASIQNSRLVGFDQVALVCTSRDNDGRAPYSVIAIKHGRKIATFNSISSLADCHKTIKTARTSGYAASICTSRDNDARSPYIRQVIDLNSGRITANTQSYGNLTNCLKREE